MYREEIHTINKIDKVLTSLINTKCKLKHWNTFFHQWYDQKLVIWQYQLLGKIWWKKLLKTADGSIHWNRHFENDFTASNKYEKYTWMTQWIYERETPTCMLKKTYIRIFIWVVFARAKNQKQSKCPSKGELIFLMQYIIIKCITIQGS